MLSKSQCCCCRINDTKIQAFNSCGCYVEAETLSTVLGGRISKDSLIKVIWKEVRIKNVFNCFLEELLLTRGKTKLSPKLYTTHKNSFKLMYHKFDFKF